MIDVCKAIDDMRNDAINEGKKEGRDDTLMDAIRNLMDTLKLTSKQAMDALKIPAKDRKRYAKML